MIEHSLILVDEFQHRRAQVLAQLPKASVAVFASGQELTRSNDTEYPFCPNKHFYYLTGFSEPDAILVLIKATQQTVLFCRDKDPLQEVWHGRRVGPEAAKSAYGVDLSFAIDDLAQQMLEMLKGCQQVHYCFEQEQLLAPIQDWLSQLRNMNRQGVKAPQAIANCSQIVDELRLIKSANELAIMRQVNEISGKAHHRAMQKVVQQKSQSGVFEYQLEAEILHEFARHGARYPAYNSIVASGDNANILHYTDNNAQLNDGDLVLIDAGGEFAGYAADITRTFPVNGKFSEPQAQLYQLVLEAQLAAIAAIKPGVTWFELNILVNELLTKGLADLGILSGDLANLIEEKACKQYFIHGLGHWLGLDVHDVGDYQCNNERQQLRPFEPGMALTIEPGLYIPLTADVDEKWRGIGVRIEDNIVVTESGCENLSANVAKTISDIEQLMASGIK